MKYIRTTSDKIYAIEDLVKTEDVRFPNGYMVYGEVPVTAVRYSDCVKDLCDVFVITDYLDKPTLWYLNDEEESSCLLYDGSGRRLSLSEACMYKIYGAIWINNGLKYVAKFENNSFKLLK